MTDLELRIKTNFALIDDSKSTAADANKARRAAMAELKADWPLFELNYATDHPGDNRSPKQWAAQVFGKSERTIERLTETAEKARARREKNKLRMAATRAATHAASVSEPSVRTEMEGPTVAELLATIEKLTAELAILRTIPLKYLPTPGPIDPPSEQPPIDEPDEVAFAAPDYSAQLAPLVKAFGSGQPTGFSVDGSPLGAVDGVAFVKAWRAATPAVRTAFCNTVSNPLALAA